MAARNALAAKPIEDLAPAGFEALWIERERLSVEAKALDERYGVAQAKLPWWARSGPMYLQDNGEHVGPVVGWPAIEELAPSDIVGAWRMIRPSPFDLKRHYQQAIQTWGERAEPGARGVYRRSLRALAIRLRRQREEENLTGLPAISTGIDGNSKALIAVENMMLALPPTLETVAAAILFDRDEASELALQHLRPALTGMMAAAIDAHLAAMSA